MPEIWSQLADGNDLKHLATENASIERIYKMYWSLMVAIYHIILTTQYFDGIGNNVWSLNVVDTYTKDNKVIERGNDIDFSYDYQHISWSYDSTNIVYVVFDNSLKEYHHVERVRVANIVNGLKEIYSAGSHNSQIIINKLAWIILIK